MYGIEKQHDISTLATAWDYFIGKFEICPKTQRPHVQYYCAVLEPLSEFKARKRISPHYIIPCRGTGTQAFDYVNKIETTAPGAISVSYGFRVPDDPVSNYQHALDAALEGKFESIDPSTYVRHSRGLHALHANRYKPVPYREVTVVYIFGPTRTGKSYHARQLTGPDPYVKSASQGSWLDGYHGQKSAIIEDLTPDCCPARILELLDSYPVRCQVKNSMVYWEPTLIVITSNYSPDEIMPNRKDVFYKRLTQVITYKSTGEHEVLILPPVDPPLSIKRVKHS